MYLRVLFILEGILIMIILKKISKTAKKLLAYFSKGELLLWLFSVTLITVSFFVFGGNGALTLIASLIGVTSILINAKGNPIGQLLMIAFSLLYGIISYSFSYYGEMITYLGMTMPMAVFALISWLRHPHEGRRSEVRVNSVSGTEVYLMLLAAAIVTGIFYFILRYFNTANIIPSTVSVTTSFLAVYLTFRRDPHFGLAYAANDVVLIILWTLASLADSRYISVTVCFAAFLINDIYGFVSWQKMKSKQERDAKAKAKAEAEAKAA